MDAGKDIKFFKTPLEIISQVSSIGWGLVVTEPLAGVKARLRKQGKQFLINWTNPGRPADTLPGNDYHDLLFEFKGFKLCLERIHVGSFFLKFSRAKSSTEVDFFYTQGLKKPAGYYYRLIVPLEKKMDFLLQLARRTFADDFGMFSAHGTQAVISGDILQICVFQDARKKYHLAIESKVKQPFESFSNKAHSVINGLGFLTGHLAGNAGWYFAYAKKELKDPVHFYHNPMRDSIHGFYTPVNTNPSAWVHSRAEARRLYDLKFLKPVSLEVFSGLCQQLYDSATFSAAILLMLEASVASLVFMPGGYAIVLESLADYMTPEEKEDLAPMKPAVSKKVRKRLTEVINEECAGISETNRNILLGKIVHINQVTNKSRLRAPFDRMKLPLNEKDLALIETRNDFLHGRIPDLTGAGEDRPEERKNKDLYYASVRFYTLLCRLILSWVGYDNYILNHAKIQEKFTRIPLDEDYYLRALPDAPAAEAADGSV